MRFKYFQFPTSDGETIYRPSVPIVFKSGKKFVFTEAVVDSGSDFTILPIEFAGEFGIKLEKKNRINFYGAGSNPFPVYSSKVKIRHIIRQAGFRPIEWESKVFFAESQPTIMLGNYGFLDKFKVIFDGPAKEIEILV